MSRVAGSLRRALRSAGFAALVWGAQAARAPQALGWNPHGHELIALIAYDELPEPTRAALARLLEAHPRYREDLAPGVPEALTSPEQRARWLFAYASTWADLARNQPEYHHGTWHYVNLPLELRGGELSTCRVARDEYPESVRRIAAIDAERRARGLPGIPAGDNVDVALAKNLKTLADPSAQREARALALAWVLHLVGDVHQPLHGVALFTHERFVTGDRGGNDILAGGRSLHQIWDELLGDAATPLGLDAELARLRRERWRWVEGRAAASELNVDRWVDEDCDEARRAVYVPAVRAAVERFERERRAATAPAAVESRSTGSSLEPAASGPGTLTTAKPDKPEVRLRAAWFQHGRDRARSRAVRAGLRLAALLRDMKL